MRSNLFLSTNYVPYANLRHITLKPAVVIVRLTDKEVTVRTVALDVDSGHAHSAFTLQSAVDINLVLASSTVYGEGYVLPHLGLKTLVRVGIGEVATSGSNLNLVVGETGITDTHQEATLNTHYGRDEFAELAGIEQSLHCNLAHIGNLALVGPLLGEVVAAHVGNHVDEGTSTEYEIVLGSRTYKVDVSGLNLYGEYIDELTVKITQVGELKCSIGTLYTTCVYSHLVVDYIVVLFRQDYCIGTIALVVSAYQRGSYIEGSVNGLFGGTGHGDAECLNHITGIALDDSLRSHFLRID